ncbi:hypothetical protein D3C86_2016230 [compost metagenome]
MDFAVDDTVYDNEIVRDDRLEFGDRFVAPRNPDVFFLEDFGHVTSAVAVPKTGRRHLENLW